jgi:hypothetical protein
MAERLVAEEDAAGGDGYGFGGGLAAGEFEADGAHAEGEPASGADGGEGGVERVHALGDAGVGEEIGVFGGVPERGGLLGDAGAVAVHLFDEFFGEAVAGAHPGASAASVEGGGDCDGCAPGEEEGEAEHRGGAEGEDVGGDDEFENGEDGLGAAAEGEVFDGFRFEDAA